MDLSLREESEPEYPEKTPASQPTPTSVSAVRDENGLTLSEYCTFILEHSVKSPLGQSVPAVTR